jgi:hypothetical protein
MLPSPCTHALAHPALVSTAQLPPVSAQNKLIKPQMLLRACLQQYTTSSTSKSRGGYDKWFRVSSRWPFKKLVVPEQKANSLVQESCEQFPSFLHPWLELPPKWIHPPVAIPTIMDHKKRNC